MHCGGASQRSRDAQSLHGTLSSFKRSTAAVNEDSSDDGLDGVGHRSAVDSVSLSRIPIDTFRQACGKPLLRKVGVRRPLTHDDAYLV